MNKKGAEMAIGTIIWIILALVVLAVIIYGFTTGWSNLWENITNLGGGNTNVQAVLTGCNTACSIGNTFDYCNQKRDVKTNEETIKDTTCYQLAISQTALGFKPCDSITTCPEGSGSDVDPAKEIS